MTKPRVALIITRMVPGGASEVVKSLIQGLSDKYLFDLITGTEDRPLNLIEKIPEINRIRTVPSLVRSIDPVQDWKAFIELCRILRGNEYDILHAHTSKAGLLSRLAGYLTGIAPIIHTAHGLVYNRPESIPGVPERGLKLWLLWKLDQLTSFGQHAMTALTNRERKTAINMGLGEPENIYTIHNGVDLDTHDADPKTRRKTRNNFDIKDGELLIVSTGRIAEEKGHDLLIESFRDLLSERPTAKLLIAGTGPMLEALRSRENDLIQSGRLILPGFIEEIHSIYHAADLYVHPARYEGFGLSVLEAMASGCPVIATRTGGVPELVEHGESGFLVEPNSKQELQNSMDHLIENVKSREDLSRKARHRAKEFSKGSMIQKYGTLYEDLMCES